MRTPKGQGVGAHDLLLERTCKELDERGKTSRNCPRITGRPVVRGPDVGRGLLLERRESRQGLLPVAKGLEALQERPIAVDRSGPPGATKRLGAASVEKTGSRASFSSPNANNLRAPRDLPSLCPTGRAFAALQERCLGGTRPLFLLPRNDGFSQTSPLPPTGPERATPK